MTQEPVPIIPMQPTAAPTTVTQPIADSDPKPSVVPGTPPTTTNVATPPKLDLRIRANRPKLDLSAIYLKEKVWDQRPVRKGDLRFETTLKVWSERGEIINIVYETVLPRANTPTVLPLLPVMLENCVGTFVIPAMRSALSEISESCRDKQKSEPGQSQNQVGGCGE